MAAENVEEVYLPELYRVVMLNPGFENVSSTYCIKFDEQYFIMLMSTFSELQRCRRQYGSIFIRLAVLVSQICEIRRSSPKI